MSKKSFRGENPAMKYISNTVSENSIEDANADESVSLEGTNNEVQAHNMNNANNTDNADYAYIEPMPRHSEKVKSAEKSKAETKSKRCSLLLQPSVIDSLGKIAHMKRTSVNDLINTLLREYAEGEFEIIAKYDTIFSDDRAF